MDMLATDFPALLKHLRVECGKTPERIAIEIGVSRAMVSHMETGSRRPPLEHAASLAQSLGIKRDQLEDFYSAVALTHLDGVVRDTVRRALRASAAREARLKQVESTLNAFQSQIKGLVATR